MKRLTRLMVCERLERRDLLNADGGLDTEVPLDDDANVLVEPTALVGRNSASRPFKGSMTGGLSFVPGTGCPNFGGLRTDSVATGTASHLGRISMTSQHCTPDVGDIMGGEMTLVAANGDKLYMEYSLFGEPLPMPGDLIVAETDFEITRGTGRFEGAQGGGHMTAYVLFAGLDPVWPASWVLEGTIGYGSSRHMKDSAIAAALLSSEDHTPPRGQGGVNTDALLDDDASVLLEPAAPVGTNSASRPVKGSVTGAADVVFAGLDPVWPGAHKGDTQPWLLEQ